MRILEISSLQETTPPSGYGGTERFVHYLSDALVSFGNEVFVVCKEGSLEGNYKIIPASVDTLVSVVDEFLPQNKVDVVHVHIQNQSLIDLLKRIQIKTVITLHNNIRKSSGWIDIMRDAPGSFYFATISESQNDRVNEALAYRAIETPDNGIINLGFGTKLEDLSTKEPGSKEHFLYLGVIARYKGVLDIVKEFSILNEHLLIVGPCNNDAEQSYLDEILNYSSSFSNITYQGSTKNESERNQIIARSKALLMATGYDPVEEDCHEAFGLVMLEANALGVPVLGFSKGNIRDFVIDGVNGYKFNTMTELSRLIEAVNKKDLSSPCMTHAKKFGIEGVACRYEEFLSGVISRQHKLAVER